MLPKLTFKTIAFAAALCLPVQLSAQSAQEVELDVLSALATPLPITVVGPLLTRSVTVTEEGDGFRATLENTTLMGLFPFGDVSMKLVPLDDDTYQISDLQFPTTLDFPGLATVTFDAMTLDGTWSATDRSYASLKAELTGLRVVLGQGEQGVLTLGRLAFDVQKEPDELDTESRFNVTLGDLSATGFGGADVSIGEVEALLSANGERPVDLYSLLREVMMVAGMRDGGVGLQLLGESLLGNTYGTVALDLRAQDLNIVDARLPDDSFFRAAGLQAQVAMQDVNPRDWGSAELLMRLDGVEQQNLTDSGAFDVDRAQVRLVGMDLPVADMFAAIDTLGRGRNSQPVSVSALLDGLIEFGGLELTSEGEGLNIEVLDRRYENDEWVEYTAYFTGYDSWDVALGVTGLNTNEGVFNTLVDLKGGTFTAGSYFSPNDMRDVNAWFPVGLTYGGQVSNLNEGFLKQLFEDVFIEDLNNPAEIILPLMLFASASVFDVAQDGNRYETGLFSLDMNADYRVFPAKFVSLFPIEGQIETRMTGFDALMAYLEEFRQRELQSDYGNAVDVSVFKSVLTVLHNLGEESDDGAVTWVIERPDVNLAEIRINGVTMYYPELSQFVPLALMGSVF